MSIERAGVRAGDVLAGKYRVERVLGIGGMGVVVAAHHVQLDERVALKFLLPEALENADSVQRFLREARAAVKIKNDHVARVSDVGQLETGSPYIVMEYLEGEDLAARLERFGRLSVAESVDFLIQAGEAIAEAHALGIVHRDLKPANLFLTERSNGEPWIKVLDFGVSKFLAPGAGLDLTRTSTLMGSPLYMSPEQMTAAKTVDLRTDLWALGVIFFELVTGRTPFTGESFPDLAIRIATQTAPLLSSFRPDVPRELDAVVARCLEKDRSRRFGGVGELAAAFAPFGTRRAQESAEAIASRLRRGGATMAIASPSPSIRDKATVAIHPTPPSTTPAKTTSLPNVTATPLPSHSWGTTTPPVPANRKRLAILVLALISLTGVALIGVGYVRRPHAAVVTAPTSASEPQRSVTSATPPLAPSPAVALEDAPTEPTAPSVAAAAPTPLPATATRIATKARPTVPVNSPPAPSEPAAGPARKSDCNPPYTIDAAGHREYKPQCL